MPRSPTSLTLTLTLVLLPVTWFQETVNSTTISPNHPRSATDEEVISAIQQAHALNMRVMLKPHVDLLSVDDLNAGLWRGDIGMSFTSESQWSEWFASYQAFIFHWASLAQLHGVEQFAVGTELIAADRAHAEHWHDTILEVRTRYRGKLTYAANC